METYKNLNGNSGIKAYKISGESIEIQFADGSAYLYNDEVNGKRTIEIMKGLAEKGIGLTTYINREVRDQFAKKTHIIAHCCNLFGKFRNSIR